VVEAAGAEDWRHADDGCGVARQSLCAIGRRAAATGNAVNLREPKMRSSFCGSWDFPLFDYSATKEKRLVSVNHPFTAPNPEDLALLDSKPLEVSRAGLRHGAQRAGDVGRLDSAFITRNCN